MELNPREAPTGLPDRQRIRTFTSEGSNPVLHPLLGAGSAAFSDGAVMVIASVVVIVIVPSYSTRVIRVIDLFLYDCLLRVLRSRFVWRRSSRFLILRAWRMLPLFRRGGR